MTDNPHDELAWPFAGSKAAPQPHCFTSLPSREELSEIDSDATVLVAGHIFPSRARVSLDMCAMLWAP